MALSERLAYILDFDVKGAVKGLEKVGSTADKELGKAEKKLDKLGGNLTKFGAGAVAFAGVAGVALLKMGAGAGEAAANSAALEQVVGDVVAHDVEGWATDSAAAVGLASKDAIAAATSFSQLGKIIGLGGADLGQFSTDLVELSADFAAFKDVSPEQALQDIQAGFAGSTEVLRKYGIFLDDATLKSAYFRETGEEVSGTLTAQQKIIAVNAELYRQGADMIGQWGRESGEFAGQQAQLKANLTNLSDSIGAGVLPMLTDLTTAANKAAAGFSKLSPETKKTIGRFAGLATGGVALLGTLSLITGQIIKMRDRFTVLGEDGTRSLNKAGKAAKGLGVAMGVAAVALAAYSLHQRAVASRNEKFADSFDKVARASDEALGHEFQRMVANGLLAMNELDEILGDFAESNIESARRVLDNAEALGLNKEQTDLLREAVEEKTEGDRQAAKNIEEYGDTLGDVTDATEDNTEATKTNYSATGRAGDAYKENTRRTEEYEAQLEATADATEDLTEATEEQISATDNLTNAFKGLRDEIADRNAYLDLESQFAVLREEGGLTETSLNDLRLKVVDYAEEIDTLPASVFTDILAMIDEGAYAEAEARLASIERARIVNVRVVQAGGVFTPDIARAPTSSGTTRYFGAEGGIVNRPTSGITLGESGPEAVIPLDRSPGNSPLGNLGGGPSIVINVNAGIGTNGPQVGRQIASELEKFYRSGGRPPRSY